MRGGGRTEESGGAAEGTPGEDNKGGRVNGIMGSSQLLKWSWVAPGGGWLVEPVSRGC